MVGGQSHFAKRRSLAVGIVVSGSSTGGIIWPIALDRLLNGTNVGFGWSIRIVGFMQLALLTLATILINPRPLPTGRGTKPNMDLLKTPGYILTVAGLCMTYFGLLVPFYFIPQYAIHRGTSVNLAFYMVSILNAASFFGRIVPGILADMYGCYNILTTAVLFSAIIAFCWTAATSTVGIVFFTLAYGFTSGTILSQQTAAFAQLMEGDFATIPIAIGLGTAASGGPV